MNQLGLALRDEGIRRVRAKNSDWMDAALVASEAFLRSQETATVEGFRMHWMLLKRPEPTHPNAWSALGKAWNDSGWVEYLRHVDCARKEARGRQCPMYRSRLYRAAA